MMENGANITVAITLEDLRRFHQEVIADTKKELEAQIAEDRGERYLSIKQVCEMLDVDPSSLWGGVSEVILSLPRSAVSVATRCRIFVES